MATREPEKLLKRVGETVRRLRAERGYSQEECAQEAVLDRAYMGGVERGQRNVGVVRAPTGSRRCWI